MSIDQLQLFGLEQQTLHMTNDDDKRVEEKKESLIINRSTWHKLIVSFRHI